MNKNGESQQAAQAVGNVNPVIEDSTLWIFHTEDRRSKKEEVFVFRRSPWHKNIMSPDFIYFRLFLTPTHFWACWGLPFSLSELFDWDEWEISSKAVLIPRNMAEKLRSSLGIVLYSILICFSEGKIHVLDWQKPAGVTALLLALGSTFRFDGAPLAGDPLFMESQMLDGGHTRIKRAVL